VESILMVDLTQVEDGSAPPQGSTDPPQANTDPPQENAAGMAILADDPITTANIPHFKKFEELI
jgi:hypothetical protein